MAEKMKPPATGPQSVESRVTDRPQWQPIVGDAAQRVVHEDELAEIIERRQAAGVMALEEVSSTDQDQTKSNVRSSLFGLALSGGGIRSGAFSLGVLETLRRSGLMKFVDYLSTVSGGGYAGAYWSTAALATQNRESIDSKADGRFSRRMLKFAHTGNYLAKTASFFNRYLPGLVLILTMCASGLIAACSGLAYLFRALDQPHWRDAIAALGFDDDFLAAIFPATCAVIVWSIAWLLSYWKYGHRLQATIAGVLLWPLIVCVLAAAGLLLGTGDIGLPFLQEQLLTAPGQTVASKSVPQSLWWLIFSVVSAALLPYFHIPTLVRSGLSPQRPLDKYTFRIASAALLVGVPFVVFALLARENVSQYLETRGQELAEADLFGGLTRDQRLAMFDRMRRVSDRDLLESFGSGNNFLCVRDELIRAGATGPQLEAIIRLNLRYVYCDDVEFADVVNELDDLKLPVGMTEKVRNLIGKAWRRTRDWTETVRGLDAVLNQELTGNEGLQKRVRQAACEYLKKESGGRNELRDSIQSILNVSVAKDGTNKPDDAGQRAERLIAAIRNLWPPKAVASVRRQMLSELIQPHIRDREPNEQTQIEAAAWRYSTDENFLRRDLESRMLQQNLGEEAQEAVYQVTKNFWPPRHDDLLDQWELRFAEQAVLELPRSGRKTADPLFAGRAIAREKMSIMQRFRYLGSFAFHWGLTPLVADEATGVEHNPLYRIWAVRQRRRSIESEIIQRLNGQILASSSLIDMLAPGAREARADPTRPKCPRSAKSVNHCSDEIDAEKPAEVMTWIGSALATQDSQPPANLSAAIDKALQAGERWHAELKKFENLRTHEDLTDALRDELKDETGTSIPLKRLEAAVSVQRGQLRQDLIQANRELLEWHLATELEKEPQQPVSLRSKDRVFGRTVLNADQAYRLWFFWRAGIVFVISLLVIDLNSTSLHGFYRTQIARNWIEPIDGVGRELPLAQLDTVAHGAPYHLISTSLNLMGRRKKDRGDTQADHFLFSKLYCGSDPVGYVRTAWFAGGKYKLPDAIAISGAAVSPAQNTGLLIRALLFLGNLRLGQWLPNPGHVSRLPMWWQRLLSPFWVTPGRVGWQSLQRAEERPHVFVTDGGHHENLGIGPLLERRCRLIVAFDAGADEHFDFVDLASLVRWAKLKHGIHIAPLTNQDLLELMPTKLMDGAAPNQEKTSVRSKASVPAQETATAPESRRLAAQHWIAARIEYPADPSQSKDASGQEQPKPLGLLIYVKTTITGEEPFEVLRYARINKHFPHDSTADQLYDPDQFATYVQLGHHIADEIQKVIRQQPHRLWQQCGPDDGFKKDMEAFLKTLS